MKNYTITAHTGAFNTEDNSIEYIKTALSKNVEILEIDIRLRADGEVVISHDEVNNSNGGVLVKDVFDLVKPTKTIINLDIKETRALKALHQLLVDYEMIDQALLTGISSKDVDIVKKDCCDVKYFLNDKPSRIKMLSKKYQNNYIQNIKDKGAVGINCNYKFATKKLSDLLHENGYELSLWTINDLNALKKALACNPDNITSRHPDLVESNI